MQVGLVTGKQQLELVEMPEPEPSAGKAVVDIAYCGICGTDLHAWLSGTPYNPAICGHEWVGHVAKAGPNVTTAKEGDRVGIGVATACGSCAACARGDASHCETVFAGMVGIGPLAAPHGGFAPAIAIDASRLYQLQNTISDEDAAILEPVTVAVHAVRRTSLRLGDSVVVIGGGPIGLLVLQCVKAAGAGTAILVEPQPTRRELGAELGADLIIDPAAGEIESVINAHLGATGADVVFECAGVPATVDAAVKLARRGGVVSLVGVPSLPAEIDAAGWLAREVQVATSIGYLREEFLIAESLVLDGRVQTRPLHTSTVTLDGLADAFARLANEPEQVKVLLDPRGGT